MLKKVFMIQMASILWSQELPFGSPYYFDIDIKEPIKKLNIEVPNDFNGSVDVFDLMYISNIISDW